MTLIRGTTQPLTHQAVQVDYYTLREVGDFLGLYFSTISVIVKHVDEMKEYQE